MYYSDHMNGTDWAAMGVMMTFLAVIILLVAWALVRWGRPVDSSALPPSDRSPRDILDERYARGEIEKDEYQERRRTLDQLPER